MKKNSTGTKYGIGGIQNKHRNVGTERLAGFHVDQNNLDRKGSIVKVTSGIGSVVCEKGVYVADHSLQFLNTKMFYYQTLHRKKEGR